MKKVFWFLKRIYVSLFLLAVTATSAFAVDTASDLISKFETIANIIFGLALLTGGGTFGFNLFKFFFSRDDDEGFGRLKTAFIGLAIAAAGGVIFALIKSAAQSKLAGNL